MTDARETATWRVETQAVHAGERAHKAVRQGPPPTVHFTPVATPIYRSAAYVYDDVAELDAVFGGREPGPVYARYGNPTISALEEAIRVLEGGDVCVVTASGMAAIHLALIAAGAASGAKIVAARDLYGATLTMLLSVLGPFGVETTFADSTDTAAFCARIADERPTVVLIEAMSNPLLRVTDVPAVVETAHAVGARVVLDATFTPPPMFYGIAAGADFVVHSLTKYLNGHADVLAGAVIGRGDEAQSLIPLSRTLGPNIAANEAYMILRGLKTLPLRFKRQNTNARLLARALARDPRVSRVSYPGLPDHPQYAVAHRLFARGYGGGMLAFELAGAGSDGTEGADGNSGGDGATRRFLDALTLCLPATSLGDVYTLVTCPVMTSHREVAPKQRERMGITPGVMRVSVGIEHPGDIIADMQGALTAALGPAITQPERVPALAHV